MALSDYQFSYRGVTFGDGTNYDVLDVRGLHDIAVSVGDRKNTRSHGYIPSIHLAEFKLIRFNVEVRGAPATQALWDDAEALLGVMSPDRYEQPDETQDRLQWKFPNEVEVFTYARPSRRTSVRRNNTEFGLLPITFQLRTYDPRIYSATEVSSGTKTGTFNVTNDGTAQAYPNFDFNPNGSGNVSLQNNTNSTGLTFTAAGPATGLILDQQRFIRGRGDLLIAYRAVALNQYAEWDSPRRPLTLDPGVNSLTLVTGDGVIITHRHTWM